MKQNVLKRLGQLEERHAALVRAQRSPQQFGFMDWFAAFRRHHNIEQQRNESQFDVLARVVGVGSWELRQLLFTPAEFRRVLRDGFKRFEDGKTA